MNIEQIIAINDAMSMFANLKYDIHCTCDLEYFKEYTGRYINALKEAKVDEYIVEHAKDLVASFLPSAQEAEEEFKKLKHLMEDKEWEYFNCDF